MAGELRPLSSADADAIAEFFGQSPALRLLAEARWRERAELWGEVADGLQAVIAIGGNALLHGQFADPAAVANLLQRRPSVRAIVGDAAAVSSVLEQRTSLTGEQPWLWRAHQPYLRLADAPLVAPAGKVRRAEIADLPAYTLAGAAMYRTELESEPDISSLRQRFTASIRAGRSFVWMEHGQVRFKCDVTVALADRCHIQGVWLEPALRGLGWSGPLLADVLQQVQQDFAPQVTLYVNDFNLPALRVYLRLGFERIGAFASAFY